MERLAQQQLFRMHSYFDGQQLPMWCPHGLLQCTVHQSAVCSGRCVQLARLLWKHIPCGARALRGLPPSLTQSNNSCWCLAAPESLFSFSTESNVLQKRTQRLNSYASSGAAPLQTRF